MQCRASNNDQFVSYFVQMSKQAVIEDPQLPKIAQRGEPKAEAYSPEARTLSLRLDSS